MADSWAEMRIGDLVDEEALWISDGYRVRNEELGSEGIPFVRGGDIGDGWINTSTEDHIRPEFAEQVRDKLTKAGDAAFITKGTVGRAGWLRAGQPAVVFAPQVAYWRVLDPNVLDSRFVYYLMRSYEFQSALDGVKTHGAMAADYVSISQQRDFRFRLPGADTQRAIARVLGSLDDKIELNRRMAGTLEAIARALFESWFVDFEPVRAKAEGRDPRLPKYLADAFPDRLVDSELGEIPKGWEIGVLGDVLVQSVDRCSPEDETRSRPYVPIECIAARSLLLAESKPGEEAQSSLTRFREGELLFGAMRPYFHKVAIAPFDGTTRTTVFVLQPRGAAEFSFGTLLLHDARTILYATNHSTGSTIPYAVWHGSLEAMPIVLPPAAVRRSFDQIARPLLDRIPPTFFANRTLAALRDALLPKLISGELRIEDAEKFSGRAV